MDGVWRSSIHHMPILNAAPLYLHQHHPSLWRPGHTLKSCRVTRLPCSVSSHVLSLKPLDTCQKNTLVPTELGIGHFIAIFDYNTFRWLAKLSFFRLQNKNENQNHSSEVSGICFRFPLLNRTLELPQGTYHKNTSATQNWLHSMDIIKITNSSPS